MLLTKDYTKELMELVLARNELIRQRYKTLNNDSVSDPELVSKWVPDSERVSRERVGRAVNKELVENSE